MVGALTDQNGLDDVIAFKLDPDGALLWQRYLATTNSNVRLMPYQVLATADGGVAVFGYTHVRPSGYENYFIIRLGQNGDVLWARYYMKNNTDSYDVAHSSQLVEKANGDLLLGMSRSDGVSLIRLDGSGAPVWHRRYSPTQTNTFFGVTGAGIDLQPDGGVLFIGRGTFDALWLCKVDPNGDVLWSHQYEGLECGSYYNHLNAFITTTDVGEHLLWWNHSLMKFNDAGQYQGGLVYAELQGISGMRELSGGDVLLLGGHRIIRTSPTGTPIASWMNDTMQTSWQGFVNMIGEPIRIETDASGFPYAEPVLVTVPTASQLGCLGAPFTPTASGVPGPTNITDSIFTYLDSVKTWTMSLGPAVEFDQLDLTAVLCSGGARPGFEMNYYGRIENPCGLTSGPVSVTMTYDPLLTYTSATPTPTSVSNATITWDLASIPGFYFNDSQAIHAMFNVPVNAVDGYQLDATMTIVQDSAEIDLVNNIAHTSHFVSSSFDPNAKEVTPAGYYDLQHDSTLTYTIHFQNTGTDTAFTVVVRDTLPLDLDITTFRLGATSHPCTWSLTGNGILTFTFDGILLPDSTTNEAESHGLVNFTIKPIQPLTPGQEISNVADIYFDFNAPVRTEPASVVVTDGTGIRPLATVEKLSIFPVPTKNTITAALPKGFRSTSAWAVGVDGLGLPMLPVGITQERASFGTQYLAPGAYVLTLQSKDGRRLSGRFVKE